MSPSEPAPRWLRAAFGPGQRLIRLVFSRLAAALAAKKHRLLLDQDLDGHTHRAQLVVRFDSAKLLLFGQAAVGRAELGKIGLDAGRETIAAALAADEKRTAEHDQRPTISCIHWQCSPVGANASIVGALHRTGSYQRRLVHNLNVRQGTAQGCNAGVCHGTVEDVHFLELCQAT